MEVLLADCPSLEMVRRQVPPKHSHLSTKLYCVTPHKTVTFPVFALWVSNVKMCLWLRFQVAIKMSDQTNGFPVFWNKSIIVPSVAHFMCIALDIRSLLCPSYETQYMNVTHLNTGRGKRGLLLQKLPDRLWGLLILFIFGHRGYFPRIKRPGREVVNSALSPWLRINGGIRLLPQYTLMAWKHLLFYCIQF